MSVGSRVCQGDQNHCNMLVGQAMSASGMLASPSLATGSLHSPDPIQVCPGCRC